MTTLTDLDQIDQEIFSQIQQQAQQMTRAFIQMCQTVYFAKLTCKRTELKAIQESLEWTATTATSYAKVGEFIAEIEPSNLDLLDCNTIKALCCDKFQLILERLKSERLTVAEVRQEMTQINKSIKKEKPPQRLLEWKREKTGEETLIICLQDVEAGLEFESRFKASCLPLPLFIRDLLRQKPVQPDMTWQPAPKESVAQMEEKLPQAEEITEIEKKICGEHPSFLQRGEKSVKTGETSVFTYR
ncbi:MULTISPECIES: hypothetical protein [Anabaena]|uniref:Uncharacterized protein n=1 Tax=Anabaena catenula FACHB-362 TaxID=2692877 RepID=A0ABR8JA48_9NOST|nr:MULTISPECIES: hypothetical protein [Anabaena]MBD2695256.1 hypothetical protein [Anabaena catenula FACHB-362]